MSLVLESELRGRVLHLRMNRPEKRNALSAELCRQLVRAIEEADNSRTAGAILLTAAGPAFSAGMDLSELDNAAPRTIDTVHEQLFTIGARLSLPIIAAVSGPALGGGTGLVANCHIVIASPQASFGLTEIRLGLWPFLVFRAVAAALGERRAVELSLTGRTFPAAEARDIGLVHQVSDAAEERAMEVAEAIASSSPTAIRTGLAYVREIRGLNWRQAGEIACQLRGQIFNSADFREGIAAFREKRGPRWPSLAELSGER
jgi:enoyl-CoA hydratase/carnithine racemase